MEPENVPRSPYSAGQMEALSALCDTLLPSVDIIEVGCGEEDISKPVGDVDDDSVIKYFEASASSVGIPHHLAVMLGIKIKHPKIFLGRLALTLLSTWIGTFIICGWKSLSNEFPYFQRFSQVSSEKRQQILLSWSESCFSIIRLFYAAVKTFTMLLFFTQVNEKGENLSWKAIGYCGSDPDARTPKTSMKAIQELGNEVPETNQGNEDCSSSKEELLGPLYRGIINFSQSREVALAKLHKLGFPVSLPHSRRARTKSLDPSFIIRCDAVVVGSGSGGGVVAGVLAKAGYKVLVLEKGSYFPRNKLPLLEGEALDRMYLGNGITGTDNMDVLILAGSTIGGGSTINWSASLRTPKHVRKEWSEKYKLEYFDSDLFEDALDVVCKRMGVRSECEREGFNNMILRQGCQNLGYPVEDIPCNAPSDHYCGWCCFGCRDGKKKSTSETWLVDLVESGNGAVLPECEAVKVITRRNKAVGVVFAFQSRGKNEIAIVESDVTIAACGAICTPPLLKRSGLKNPNIGKNLHLHPVVFAWGYFPDGPDAWPGEEKKSYEGSIMTAMSGVVANSQTSGYGTIIQTPSLHPGMFAALMPWLSGTDMKNRMLKFSRTAHIFALARDEGSGVVKSSTDISYSVGNYDQENLRKGIEKVLRILAAAGAEEIGTHHRKGRVLKVKQASKAEFENFVKEESSRSLTNLSTPVCSAHQMGSCRMGVDPGCSAVSPRGETWEVEGLFVADTSVFPTALGVNPMVTVQAIAYCTAQSVLEALGGKKLM